MARARESPRGGSDVLGAGDAALVALEAELAEERERRLEIDRRLAEQEAELAELRDRVGRLQRHAPEDDARPPAAPRPARQVALPQPPDGDTDRLRRCEGFDVAAGSAVVGRVEAIRFGRRHDRPDALLVAVGRRGRLAEVPTDAVEEIHADRCLVVVAADRAQLWPRRPGWRALRRLLSRPSS